MAIKPLIHLSRDVVKKWDGNGSLVVLFYTLSLGVLLLFLMMAVIL